MTATDCPYTNPTSPDSTVLEPAGTIPAPGNLIIAGIAGTKHWSQTPTAILNFGFANGSTGAGSDDLYAFNNWDMAGSILPNPGDHQDLLSGGGNLSYLRAEIRYALESFEDVANITFNETGGFQGANTALRFMAYNNTPGYNGVATFPGTDAGPSGFEAFVVFDNSAASMTTNPEFGGSSNRLHVAIHEIQHSLGIGHPHDTGGGSGMWTVNGNTAAGDNVLDNDRYTVMSYERGGLNVNNQTQGFGYSVTPMALDIAALQYLYGSSTNHNGNTTYTLTDPGTAGRDLDGSDGSISIGRAFYGIWDTGGSDRIEYVGTRHVLINLNEATMDQTTTSSNITDMINTLNGSLLFDFWLPVAGGAELRADLLSPLYHAGGFFSRVFSTGGAADLGGFSIANSIYADAGHTTIIEHASGGNDGDILIGNEQANVLDGNGGHDLILGLNGNDTLYGDDGNDELYGGNGADLILGGNFTDTLIGGAGNDTLSGGFGSDTIHGGGGDDLIQVLDGEFFDSVDGGSGKDTLDHSASSYGAMTFNFAAGTTAGGNGAGTLAGIEVYLDGSGSNTIYDRASGFQINAGGGNDLVHEHAGGGKDNFHLGGGNDTLNINNDAIGGGDVFNGGSGNDLINFAALGSGFAKTGAVLDLAAGTLSAGSNSQVVSNFENANGTQGAETLLGTSGSNVLNGNGGNDTINGRNGKDTINGGGGNDVILDDDGINGDVHKGGNGTDVIDYSAVTLTGTTIDIGAGTASVSGGNSETISGFENVIGSKGGDTIIGTTDDNSLKGNKGADRLSGLGGNDDIAGGDGNDTVLGGNGADHLNGGKGKDNIQGGGGNDDISGGGQADVITGGGGNDTIKGGGGGDSIDGGDGNDSVIGGGGNNTLDGGDGKDTLTGGNGDDIITGGKGNDKITGGDGADHLTGGAQNDTIVAGAGNDTVFGGDGNDKITGGAGGDRIISGPGNDTLTGGTGLDDFVFGNGFGTNEITDFNANNGEHIDLSGVTAITGFNDLMNNHLSNAGGTAVITVGANSIQLTGVAFNQVGVGKLYSEDDFLF